MRASVLVLLVGLAGLALAPLPAGPAGASCAGPQISVQGVDVVRGHPVLTRGSEVTVRGRYFVDGCDDTGSQSAYGCSGEEHEVAEPMQDVELRLGDQVAAVADADDQGRVTWTFTVPDDLRPGPAGLVASTGERTRVRIAQSTER